MDKNIFISFDPNYLIQDLSTGNRTEIIVNGNKAGARTCEYMGAMEAFKHLNHLMMNQ